MPSAIEMFLLSAVGNAGTICYGSSGNQVWGSGFSDTPNPNQTFVPYVGTFEDVTIASDGHFTIALGIETPEGGPPNGIVAMDARPANSNSSGVPLLITISSTSSNINELYGWAYKLSSGNVVLMSSTMIDICVTAWVW